MSTRRKLRKSIYSVLMHCKDGSFATQNDRKNILYQIVDDLVQGGNYQLNHINGLKRKHISYLNEKWQEQGLSAGTIKNRNSKLRWLCEKINKPKLMLSNDDLGIAQRVYVTNKDKGTELSERQMSKITNDFVYVQLMLQRHLGLRRKEAIYIQPHKADKGNYVALDAAWCKGKRARTIPIVTPQARYWLNEAKKLVTNKTDSLIGNSPNYLAARDRYDKQLQRAGINRGHGIRHQYAHERYQQLTGWLAPAKGGPSKPQLSVKQQALDFKARKIISEELGHSRVRISAVYLGR